jgi:hypothetical protein
VDPLASVPNAAPDTGKPFAERLESFAERVPATDLSAYIGREVSSFDIDAASPAAGSDTLTTEQTPVV